MSDTALNKIIQYGTAAARAAFTPNPATGSQVLYIWYDTDSAPDTYVWDGSAWVQINVGGGGGAPSTSDYLTHSDESTDLPNSRELLAGTGLSFDDTVANQRTINADANRRQITLVIDGGGSAITTGVKGFISVPFACTIQKVRLLSVDASATAGDIVIDIWKDTYANYPPTVADTITAAAKPTLSTANKSEDSTLTGWTTSIAAGDILGFNVDSASTVTRVSLTLEVE